MTVAELITRLQMATVPPTAEIWVESYDEPLEANTVCLEVLTEHGYPKPPTPDGILGPPDGQGVQRYNTPMVVVIRP
jgi:hypothetical protein